MRSLICGPHEFIVANMHADCFDCKPTALSNRLKRLEAMGFVQSERFGVQRRFYLKGK
jgi:DNA-binding MarR family transcriptional regulator